MTEHQTKPLWQYTLLYLGIFGAAYAAAELLSWLFLSIANQMTFFHGITFIGLLAFVVFLVYTTFKAPVWPMKFLAGLWALFIMNVAVWILFIGYAKSECTDIGWDSGKWTLEDGVICVERVEMPLDKAEPKDPLRWRPYH